MVKIGKDFTATKDFTSLRNNGSLNGVLFSQQRKILQHTLFNLLNQEKSLLFLNPSDTLYGFACDACSREAVHRIYQIKGRKLTSPLAVCVGDVSDIKRFAITDHLPETLLDALLPGPVTSVLKRGKSSILENSLNPGLYSIGFRVPDNDFLRTISRGSGSTLALTSANLSGHPSSVTIRDFDHLWDHCAYVFDGGTLPMGRAESTIVDLTSFGKYRILRSGRSETVAILERHLIWEDEGSDST